MDQIFVKNIKKVFETHVGMNQSFQTHASMSQISKRFA
jgi:hypothetical protein